MDLIAKGQQNHSLMDMAIGSAAARRHMLYFIKLQHSGNGDAQCDQEGEVESEAGVKGEGYHGIEDDEEKAIGSHCHQLLPLSEVWRVEVIQLHFITTHIKLLCD
jgi:hypothetical protein